MLSVDYICFSLCFHCEVHLSFVKKIESLLSYFEKIAHTSVV